MVKTIDAGSEQFVMSKEQELQTVREEWHSAWDKGHENKINDKQDHGVRSKRCSSESENTQVSRVWIMEDCIPVKKIRPSAELLHRWLIVFIMFGFLLTALKDNLNSMQRGHLSFPSLQPTMYLVHPIVEETLW